MNRIKSIQVKKKMLRDEDVASIESESSESDDIIEETDDDVFFGNEKDISIKEKPKIEIENNHLQKKSSFVENKQHLAD